MRAGYGPRQDGECADVRLVEIPLDRPGFSGFFCAWLVRGRRTFLVDTGPARSADALVERLKTEGLARLDLVLLTHIHLDHAGGLARVLEAFPDARAVCHRKAVPHLSNPARLWEGSRKVLGDLAEAYGAPRPVPEATLIAHDEAGVPGLRILETPGHAAHHVGYACGGRLFAGEAAGNRFRWEDREILRPATPPRFFLEECLASVDRMRRLEDQTLCYGHYGTARSSHAMLDRFRRQLLRWRDLLLRFLRQQPEADVEACLGHLLAEDPELRSFGELAPEPRRRERYFLENSIRGYLGYLRG
jgi:glyoxylase-like metal-dependent hydrolase (beta-lactamase superfamily II)